MAGSAINARVAQLVEQRIENPRVGGSNPPPGTIFSIYIECFLQITLVDLAAACPSGRTG